MSTQDDAGSAERCIPDPARIVNLMRKLDAAIEAGGELDEEPMQLRVLYDVAHDDFTTGVVDRVMGSNPNLAPQVAFRGYVAQVMLDPRMLRATGELEPWVPLRKLALNLAYAGDEEDVAMLREILGLPGIVGLAVASEGVYAHVRGRDTFQDVIRARVNLNDLPEARSARQILAMDHTGRLYSLMHQQGEPPEVVADDEVRGEVSTILRLMIDAINGTVPAAEEHPVRYPTLVTLHPEPGSA